MKIKVKMGMLRGKYVLYRADTGKILVDDLDGEDAGFYRKVYERKLNERRGDRR
jgi:hypothetical protein